MRKLNSLLFYLFFVIVLYGCTSHRVIVDEPTVVPMKKYNILEVKDVGSKIQEEEALEAARKFREMIVNGFVRYNTLYPNQKLFSQITPSTDETNRVLLLDCIILSYEKGSRAKRYFFGFGAGKASSILQCVFIDKTTSQKVSKANFEGELTMGIFGGSVDEAQGAVVNAIIEYVKQQY